jgi:hypothetical protein
MEHTRGVPNAEAKAVALRLAAIPIVYPRQPGSDSVMGRLVRSGDEAANAKSEEMLVDETVLPKLFSDEE